MSVAGTFFDELLSKYSEEENIPNVQSQPKVETLMVENLMNSGVTQAFQLVKAH
jgi:hypothetical protein